MSQGDQSIANQPGAAFRSDLNDELQALVTLSSGASAPSVTYAYQLWVDTTNGVIKQRNSSNSAWVDLWEEDGAPGFASGTRMLFQQTSAPTGWTKETTATYNDSALKFTTGTVSTGGSDAFSTHFGTSKSTASYTLTTTDIPSHYHSVNINSGYQSANHTHQYTSPYGAAGGYSFSGASTTASTQNTGTESASHYHNVSGNTGSAGSGGGHSHTLSNFNIKYAEVIIAQKD